MRYDLLLLALSFGSWLIVLYASQRSRLRTDRRAFFDESVACFDTIEMRQHGINFPMLRARYRGYDASIEPVVDDLTLRKLPQLWGIVTLRAPTGCLGVVDAVARPQNTEFYSPWDRLAHQVERGFDWPADVLMRTNDPRSLPPRESLDALMRLFEDPRMKELLISPRGIRLVYLLAQADRSRYLVLRQATFGAIRLDAQAATRLLNMLISAYEELCDEPHSTVGSATTRTFREPCVDGVQQS